MTQTDHVDNVFHHAGFTTHLPMVHMAAETYQKALDSGWGHEDKGARFKIFEKALDVRFRKKNINR